MERITAPISKNDRGAALLNLQDALIVLLSAGQISAAQAERPITIEKLPRKQREEALCWGLRAFRRAVRDIWRRDQCLMGSKNRLRMTVTFDPIIGEPTATNLWRSNP